MKKFSELSKSLKECQSSNTEESYTNYDRESFIKGILVRVGDIVEHNGKRAEVLAVGSNYATLIREGKTFKSWITEMRVVDSKTNVNHPSSIGENLSFKGYKTKNFTQEISNQFIEKFNEAIDPHTYYNCIIACDNLLSASPTSLIEKFHKYSNDFDRVVRYTNKMGINIPRIQVIGEAIQIVKEHNNEL